MPDSLVSLKPQTKYNLIILFIDALLFWMSITCLLPTLPTYIQDVGATTQEVGFVMGCFAIGLLCSRVWLGEIADRKSRKLVILIGTLVAGIAPLGYIFFQSILQLALIRAFHGVSVAAFTIGFSALVVDFAPRQMRATLIGYMNLAVPVGMGFGPALGGFLQKNSGYGVLFAVSATCGVLALLLATRLKTKAYEIVTSTQVIIAEGEMRNFKQLSQDGALMIPAIVLFMIGLIFGALVTFLPLYVRQLSLDFNIGFFYTVAAIASFMVRLFIGSITNLYGKGLAISSSLICYLVSMALLAVAHSPLLLLLSAFVEGLAGGIAIPTILTLISDRSRDHERGKVYALCLGGFDVGIALAGPILGFVETIFGYQGLFILVTFLSAIALVIFMTRASKGLGHSLRFSLGQEPDAYALD